MRRIAELTLLLVPLLFASAAHARSSDRQQPMDLEANHQRCDISADGECVFTGDVRIRQGTLDIAATRAVINRAAGDPSRAVLTGGPVVLRQQMDDGTPMTARAATVDYDLRNETVVFSGNVVIEQPRGTMTGERVTYNLATGQVNSGSESGNGSGRVRMRIMPNNAAPAGAAAATPAPAAESTDAAD